jgi:hypothetical protein
VVFLMSSKQLSHAHTVNARPKRRSDRVSKRVGAHQSMSVIRHERRFERSADDLRSLIDFGHFPVLRELLQRGHKSDMPVIRCLVRGRSAVRASSKASSDPFRGHWFGAADLCWRIGNRELSLAVSSSHF